MKFSQIILIAVLILLGTKVWSQQIVVVEPFDILALNAAEAYRGTIQWESSGDGENWLSIDGGDTSGPFEVTVSVFPSFYRARIDEEGCETPHYSEVIEVLNSENTKRWSDPITWGGTLPLSGEDVIIDDHILLDIASTPALRELTINGHLTFDRQDVHLTAENIVVNGVLTIGSTLAPFEHEAIITLNGVDNTEGGSDRGIMVPGTLEFHGATPDVLWTKINDHLEKGEVSVELEKAVEWRPGGEVVMAPTDFYRAGHNQEAITQRVALSTVDGKMLTIVEGSNSQRWGRLQYATPTGMSLDPSAERVAPPIPNSETHFTPTVLDERAEIGYLERTITIESPEDDLWTSSGFGAHIMIMPSGVAHVEGVQINRGGQRGHIRRYPFHWHNLSYSAPNFIGDSEGQYFNNSVINESTQRGVVIHGTNGVEVKNNIVYHVQGHGIFTEDAVERRNVIDGNLVLHIRPPVWGTQLKNHEQVGLSAGASSGFWISNPDNTITNNAAADCRGFGFWLAFPTQAWGDNIGTLHEDGFLYQPFREQFGVFDNNVSHSNKSRALMLDLSEVDNSGNVNGSQYWPSATGLTPSWPYEDSRTFILSNSTFFKSGHNGVWDRSTGSRATGLISADNCGRFFAGAGADGVIEKCLVVGTSLNHEMNGTGREVLDDADLYNDTPGHTPSAFATYHHGFKMTDNIVVNFPLKAGDRSGVFATDDYYIRPVEKGQLLNVNNKFINSHPGYKAAPWRVAYDHFTFASAIWDPHGYWGEAGSYFVYDDPFLTHGKEVTLVGTSAEATGGVVVEGPFYGFRGFVLYGVGDTYPQNQPYFDLWPIHVSRRDASLTEVATWEVAEAQASDLLAHMKDFATDPVGIYEVTFPGQENPTDFSMLVDNMLEPEDLQVIGIQYDGSYTNIRVGMEAFGTRETYSSVGSLDEVRNSSGATYWQDSANNRVWVKLRGGVWKYYTEDFTNEPEPTFEHLTYEQLTFFIRPI